MDGDATRALEALEELVSAVEDSRRRMHAGDIEGIDSSMLRATLDQAERVIQQLRGKIALGL